MSEESKPKNVIEAIARVMSEMGGVPKMTGDDHKKRIGQRADGEYGVKYAYRSIDQIASLAQPLFGMYGVVIVPTVLDAREVELVINDKPWSDTFVTVKWDVYGPAGLADKLESITKGIGRDNSDKGMNKAMTTAYKNLLLRLLCIGDPKDDTDHERHEATEPSKREVPKAPTTKGKVTTKGEAGADLLKKLARSWAGGNAEDAQPAGRKALSLVIEDYKEGSPVAPASIEAAIQLVKVAIHAKQWAGVKDLARSIELVNLAKFAVMPDHEGLVLTPEEADTIMAYMDSVPFVEVETSTKE